VAVAILVVATLVDLGIAVLFVAVSGFILEGVNNTGPRPGATLFVLFVLFCIAAPIAAWVVRGRGGRLGIALALALAPAVGLGLALLLEPLFV
jgi:hypothetical protein